MCTLSSSHKNKIYKDLFRPFVMDVQIAERLVSALEKRPMTGVVPDKALFLDVLLSTDVPESSRFYEVVPDRPDKRQLVQETGRYSYFSLRRVMRNRNARLPVIRFEKHPRPHGICTRRLFIRRIDQKYESRQKIGRHDDAMRRTLFASGKIVDIRFR